MNAPAYQPRPGSTGDLTLQHLRAHGRTSEVALAIAIDKEPCDLGALLAWPIKQGAIKRDVVGDERFYSVGDGEPPAADAEQIEIHASRAGSASDGSQKPNGAGHGSNTALARAGSDTPRPGSQHVLKAEASRPDATDREISATRSPVGGPTGVGQAAAAAPSAVEKPEALRGKNAAWWLTGELAVEAEDGTVILFDGSLAAKLVAFLIWRGGGA
jgi:hypothetical protein